VINMPDVKYDQKNIPQAETKRTMSPVKTLQPPAWGKDTIKNRDLDAKAEGHKETFLAKLKRFYPSDETISITPQNKPAVNSPAYKPQLTKEDKEVRYKHYLITIGGVQLPVAISSSGAISVHTTSTPTAVELQAVARLLIASSQNFTGAIMPAAHYQNEQTRSQFAQEVHDAFLHHATNNYLQSHPGETVVPPETMQAFNNQANNLTIQSSSGETMKCGAIIAAHQAALQANAIEMATSLFKKPPKPSPYKDPTQI